MQRKQKQAYLFRTVLEVTNEKGKKKPYREIAIGETQSLSTLARAIVEAFGFDFDHCYGFYDNVVDIYESKEMYELFTDLGEDPSPGAAGVERTKIARAFPRVGKTMCFLFDYGDGWHFTVTLLEKTPVDRKTRYPIVTASTGEAPEQYPPLDEEDDEEFFFDNCAICQGMKKAEQQGINLSVEELKELFKKQNEQSEMKKDTTRPA